jgi:DNA recombination protein RmuC
VTDLHELLPLAGAAILLLALGALLAWLVLRGRVARAFDAGRASRDGELASLAEQRDAARTRNAELEAGIRRHETAVQVAERSLRDAAAQAAAAQARLEQLLPELAEARGARDDAQARLVRLTGEHASLRASAEEKERSAAEKLKLVGDAEVRLREAFQNLANRILEEKGEHLREQSALQLGGLLDPLKVQLKEFREAVTQVHASDQRERGMLSEQIQNLRQLNETISRDAINLTRALKGDAQIRGAWGEMVLERVLEASGLQAGREYHTQASFTGSEGRQRPDAIVHLPESKDIVIDAKVSLIAYERSASAADEETRTQAMREHLAAMRRHIDQLGARSYTDIEQLHTLDFVLMFVPVEAAFIEAVRADDSLYTYALQRNVSLVSPSTLLATLRTVAHLWRIERRNINAQEIARRGAQLHDNFALLVDELTNLGTQLERAQHAHASALRRLVDGGKGSIALQVQSLREMGAPAKKSLPRGLLEDAGASESDSDSDAVPAQDGEA